MWKEQLHRIAPYLSGLVFLSSIGVLFTEGYKVLCIPLLSLSINILIIRYINDYHQSYSVSNDHNESSQEHIEEEPPELIRVESEKSVEEKKNE
jgi:hypothetical protein